MANWQLCSFKISRGPCPRDGIFRATQIIMTWRPRSNSRPSYKLIENFLGGSWCYEFELLIFKKLYFALLHQKFKIFCNRKTLKSEWALVFLLWEYEFFSIYLIHQPFYFNYHMVLIFFSRDLFLKFGKVVFELHVLFILHYVWFFSFRKELNLTEPTLMLYWSSTICIKCYIWLKVCVD